MRYRKNLGFCKRMTVDVPSDLYRRLEEHAAVEGRSINEVAFERLKTWLQKLPSRRHSGRPEITDGL